MRLIRCGSVVIGLLVLLSLSPICLAREAHGLLMWVGRYGSPALDLPGIDHDARRAREIAEVLGVPADRRIEISEEALTLQALVAAFRRLEQQVRPGDRVLIYFSGHGRQIDGRTFGVRCSEGIVTQDAALYLDVALERTLERLADRAGEVVMFNDSCHAGGAAAKSWELPLPGEVPKFFRGPIRSAHGSEQASDCGQPVNQSPPAAFAQVLSMHSPGVGHSGTDRRWLHIAAAAADEIAFAGPDGSRATRAWHACLTAGAGRQSPIDGEALRQCAQSWINAGGGRRQSITLFGDRSMRLR